MKTILTASAVLLACSLAGRASAGNTASPDSSTTIPGGAEGKTMNSITVEGEDRVRVQFERPPLKIHLDPATAPGLDWDSTWLVLDASAFDFMHPLLARSATERTPYAPAPWLDAFREGPVARFRPQVTGVEAWKLEVADSRGGTVATYAGTGNMPKEIEWDGRTQKGGIARADLTYSYVVHATDKAGNKRSFMGDAFEIGPRAVESKDGVELAFSLPAEADAGVPAHTAREIVSRLNEYPADRAVMVDVTAPTAGMATAIADRMVKHLQANLTGEASRVTSTIHAEAGGGERAALVVRVGAPTSRAATTGGKR